jgi:hypothetical protein
MTTDYEWFLEDEQAMAEAYADFLREWDGEPVSFEDFRNNDNYLESAFNEWRDAQSPY